MYTDLQAEATALLTELGVACKIVGDKNKTVRGVILNPSKKDREDWQVDFDAVMYLAASGLNILPGDLITIGKKTVSCVQVITPAPDGTTAIYHKVLVKC